MENTPPAQYRGFDTYLKTDHHTYVKENFKELAKLIRQRVDDNLLSATSRVLDVGCATGALISYLGECFEDFSFTGLDISSELIGIAKEKLPKSEFIVGNITNLPNSNVPLYDVALCIGVIGIFDEKEAKDALERLVGSVRSGGVVYVFHQFNEIDIDVMVKHRRVGQDVTWDGWGAGWNIYSYRTVGQWLDGRVASHRFVDFTMPFAIAPQDNPVRTWTVDMADGTRRLTNGLKLLVDLKFLEIVV